MGSLGLLLMLLMFMFSIIGISQFWLVNLDGADEMGYHVNFQTFGAAFLTLMRCATGEAWNSIMFESARERSILYQCEYEESYELIVARGDDPTQYMDVKGCGPTYFAYTFHILFQVIVSQVFLNLFIAIIIDSFMGQNDLANLPVEARAVEKFPTLWSKYDPYATSFIPVSMLADMLRDMAEDEDTKDLILFEDRVADVKNDDGTIRKDNSVFRNKYVMILDIPTYGTFQKVMFFDVLQ